MKKSVLTILALLIAMPAARAQEDGGDNAMLSRLLQRYLAVLQTSPDEASPACIDALKEMHKTQDQVTAEEGRTKDQDLEVARDVLASDTEDATQICGADAHRLCDGGKQSPALVAACQALRAGRPGH
ncbi:hypothetical protein, partial [Ameyamaea chiangmaiensis]